MDWAQVMSYPFLKNLPFKIELNRFGQILMSPASNTHGVIQSETVYALKRHKRSGRVIAECSVQTTEGVRVADVAWASDEFIRRNGTATPYQEAPELCIEIVSPSNSREELMLKKELYLAKGAQEVWIVDEKGKMEVHSHRGQKKVSDLVPVKKIKI
jgi:Uma2 family endonuclease